MACACCADKWMDGREVEADETGRQGVMDGCVSSEQTEQGAARLTQLALQIDMCSKIIIPKANQEGTCQLGSVHFTLPLAFVYVLMSTIKAYISATWPLVSF